MSMMDLEGLLKMSKKSYIKFAVINSKSIGITIFFRRMNKGYVVNIMSKFSMTFKIFRRNER